MGEYVLKGGSVTAQNLIRGLGVNFQSQYQLYSAHHEQKRRVNPIQYSIAFIQHIGDCYSLHWTYAAVVYHLSSPIRMPIFL